MSTITRRTLARALPALAVLPLLAVAFVGISASQAHASGGVTPTPTTPATSTPTKPTGPTPAQVKAAKVKAFDRRVIKVVSSRRGSPYSYGAAGPHRFDCSGLTMWTFKHLHRRLPHSAAAQYGRVKHLHRSQRRIGDLVFFHDGGGIYHVAIYAGHNRIWHAPFPGARVRLEHIWTSSVYYGRVR